MAVTRQTFKNLATNFINSTFADFTKTFTIEALTNTPDGQGGYVPSWSTFATITGFVQKKTDQSGGEMVKDDQLEADYPTTFSFKYISGITNEMRVLFNGKYYNIRSIISVQEVDVWIDIVADESDAT